MTAVTKRPAMTAAELRAAREELGMTQQEVANLYELSLSGYKKYELGVTAIPGPVRVLTMRLLSEHRKK